MKLPKIIDALQGSGSVPYKATSVVSHHRSYSVGQTTGGLSVFFTVLCIIDLFGVFPIVALPKSIISCGAYGVPLVLSVFAIQLYTAVLLGRSWLVAQEISPQIGEKNRFPYAAVAELAFGPKARSVVTFLIDATVFGAGVPNLLVASQSLQMFWYKITGGQVGISFCIWMLVIGLLLCPVMWLGSPKDMKPLAVMSVLIVTMVAASTWSCILMDDVTPTNKQGFLDHKPRAIDFLIAYGIISFQFDIHPMLLTIQVDMKNSRKINTAVFSGFAFTAIMFGVTTVLAWNRYGQNVNFNILQGIPPSIPLYVVALLVTLQLCLSNAVSNSALFQHIEDLLNIPRDFNIKRCLLRSFIVAVAVFIGEAVPRFDVVMGLVGSTLTGPLMFIFPPLFFLKLCYMKSYLQENDPDFPPKDHVKVGKQNGHLSKIQNGGHVVYNTFSYGEIDELHCEYKVKWYDVLLASVIMVFGITATIIATYSSWADAITYASFVPPCLVNATAAARSLMEIINS